MILDRDLRYIIELAHLTGQEVLRLRDEGLEIIKKPDGSPVTNADLRAHKMLELGLEKLAHGTVISEEGDLDQVTAAEVAESDFWLVDPIDGTRDYIRGEPTFAICIAHIQNQQTRLGLLAIPAQGKIYFAERGRGSFEASLDDPSDKVQIQHPKMSRQLIAGGSHAAPSAKIKEVFKIFGVDEVKRFGSALKFAHLAKGEFDIFPRFGMTYEWDTAAGQLIVEEAGCVVMDIERLEPLKYGKRNWENDGGFLAIRSDRFDLAQLETLRDIRRSQVVNHIMESKE